MSPVKTCWGREWGLQHPMGFSPYSLQNGGVELAQRLRAIGDLNVPLEPAARRRRLSTRASSCRRIYSPLRLTWLPASPHQRAAKPPLAFFGSRVGEGLSLPPQAPREPFSSSPRLRCRLDWRARAPAPRNRGARGFPQSQALPVPLACLCVPCCANRAATIF